MKYVTMRQGCVGIAHRLVLARTPILLSAVLSVRSLRDQQQGIHIETSVYLVSDDGERAVISNGQFAIYVVPGASQHVSGIPHL